MMGPWRLSVLLALVSPGLCFGAESGWRIDVTRSPLDGVAVATAIVESSNKVSNQIGTPEAAALVLRCQGREGAVYVAWPRVIDLRSAMVRYRIDGQPVQSAYWLISDSGTAIGFFRVTAASKAFVRSIRAANTLVVAATPHGAIEEAATFNLEGVAAALDKIEAACAGGPPPGTSPP